MATQEKLLKSLESLNNLINSKQNTDGTAKKKEKLQHCNFITEAMSNPTIKIAPTFVNLLSFSIELLLQLCDDPESDIRMVADECLNRIIKAMNNGNIAKVQIELHKEIKKNGAARSLRAAFSRFAQLAHLIRPHKGKPYVVNLVPCIVKMTEREEDMIHESLAAHLPKIMFSLGCFSTDNDIKALLKGFLNNIHTQSAVKRRTTASCILAICLNCRKPFVFITYILNNLIDYLVPIQENHSTSLILCVLGCLKTILPYIQNSEEQEIKGSFGTRKEINEVPIATDKLLQVYELCLHFTNHSDHNVINASLETLNVLLQNCPPELKSILLSANGITKSRIQLSDNPSKTRQRSPSQASIATTHLSGDDNLALEAELTDTMKSDIERWIDESKLSVLNVTYAKTSDVVEKQHTVSVSDTTGSSFEQVDTSEYSNIAIGVISDTYDESVKSESFVDNLDKLMLSDNSSEKSYSHCADDKAYVSLNENILFQDVDIGEYCDKHIPMNYCTRHLVKCFLLTGNPNSTIPDKTVRVSVKSLALSCLSTIFQIYPQGLLLYLDKACMKSSSGAKNGLKQQISDILLFSEHTDPQLRGVVRVIIGSFLKSVLLETENGYDSWIENNSYVNNLEPFQMERLLKSIIKGLKDESSTCSRQSLIGLMTCMNHIIESSDCMYILPVLNALPILAKNPYWLVKVKLLELLSMVEYIAIQHITESREYQNIILHNVFFELLKDEDQRVRNSCSNAIIKVIPLLYFDHDNPSETLITRRVVQYREKYLPHLSKIDLNANVNKKNFINNTPFPFREVATSGQSIENSLSRVIHKLQHYLLTSTSKFFVCGIIETLSLLSKHYPTTIYKSAWGCFKEFSVAFEKNIFQRSLSTGAGTQIENSTISSSEDLLSLCINFLSQSTFCYDFNIHLNLLKLAGNLYSGKCIENLRQTPELNLEESKHLWEILTDKKLRDLSELFLTHIVKLLNIFSHVLDEVVPHSPQIKTVLPNLPAPSTLSPIKRRKSDLGEKTKILSQAKLSEKDEKGDRRIENVKVNSMGYFVNLPHYMKIYELLRTAYNNYKITLDTGASENFICLLKSALSTLSQILEIATLVESGRIAEEVLTYLRSTFNLEPASTVECVQQLLKSLFGSNLSPNISEIIPAMNVSSDKEDNESVGFYFNATQKPYNDISSYIKSLYSITKFECDSDITVMGYLHRREPKKITLAKGSDKILASYIRIFEPMVIKSLKQYTITSDVKLQCKVLQLLSQLVQLRVNYCLLDSEQIFIGFVLKQFEFIEEGQIIYSNELIPKIFQFLVHLSYGKQHSKSIISVPKILQLCDGLMASGQSPLSHCIPALQPIIEDIFLLRNKSNTPDFKELETTREVLLSMLLRLLEYREVIDMLVLILNESKYCDNADKWLRWSRQIIDVMIPMLRQNKIRLEDMQSFDSMRKLVFTLNPRIFRPPNEYLLMLFQEPCSADDPMVSINRWMGKILILFMILMQTKEEVLLLKIIELQSDFNPNSIFYKINFTPDPLNVTATTNLFDGIAPELILIRFIFRVIDVVSQRCLQCAKNGENSFIVQQLSIYLMCCLYIFQSGSHCKTTNIAIDVINNESKLKKNDICLDTINYSFIKCGNVFPLLTFQWCYLLFLLNFKNKSFWTSVLNSDDDDLHDIQKESVCMKRSLNMEIVKTGSCIIFCDYLSENMNSQEQLSWMLMHHVDLILNLSDEPPVSEFLVSLHRDEETSAMFLNVISSKQYSDVNPLLKINILNSIENVHSSQTGPLLHLLTTNLLNTKELAVSRLVSNVASRKVEYLLTLSTDDVTKQLSKENLLKIIEFLTKSGLARKHETLASLLNKLATQFYHLNPIEFEQRKSFDPELIKKLSVDKNWYLSQVKSRCCNMSFVGEENAELLNKLDYEDLLDIMGSANFNKLILKDCISWCVSKMKNSCLEEINLLKATVEIILKDVSYITSLLPTPHEVYSPHGREPTLEENDYTKKLSTLLANEEFWMLFNSIIPSVYHYINSLPLPNSIKFPDDKLEVFLKFAVFCLESTSYLISVHKNNLNINIFDLSLNCSEIIFKQGNLQNLFSLDCYMTWLCSSVNSVYKIVCYLLLDEEPLPTVHIDGLKSTLEDVTTVSAGFSCYQLSVLVTWIEKTHKSSINIPLFLLKSIESIIVSLSRLPLMNSYILTPPSSWKNGWEPTLFGSFKTQVPPLPIKFLQEVEILEEFIFRITLLGWTNRQQFEETWMCLLSVLSQNPSDINIPEEINSLTHASSLAVQAITSLLIESLYEPVPGNRNISKIIHVPRDLSIDAKNASIRKLKVIHSNFEHMYTEYLKLYYNKGLVNVFRKPNLEKINENYSYSQVSVEFLLISARIVDIVDENCLAAKMYQKRQDILKEYGLDLNSCIQFLLELYSQWLKTPLLTPLRILHEVVKSLLLISDLFTEKSQFSCMLECCLDLSKTHISDDEILHQYLVIGICKAAAVLLPDMEILESIKRTLVQSLKSAFLPTRIASLHGILYILQGCILSNTIIGGLSEELQLFLPLAVEYVQCNIHSTSGVLAQSQEHSLLLWALSFYLIENMDESHLEAEFVATVIQAALNNLATIKFNVLFHNSVMKSLERLVIKRSLSDKLNSQIMKFSLSKMKHTNHVIALPATQLLLTCMYTECADQLQTTEESNGIVQSNPDNLVQTIEKVSAIFDKIKKGYPAEVELLCAVLPSILNDFFPPSDILTKVISEFLSPQQRHPKLLSRVVFQVFECAIKQSQLLLLQDWVVFSLSNFIQLVPIGMATWCLTCFFVSATTNEWLRSLFPYIQSRIGRYEYEDRKMLCIAGADFYNNLTNAKQKQTFIETFEKVKTQADTPYEDLLASL